MMPLQYGQPPADRGALAAGTAGTSCAVSDVGSSPVPSRGGGVSSPEQQRQATTPTRYHPGSARGMNPSVLTRSAAAVSAAGRPNPQDNTILQAVRRQIEALDEKLSGQITRSQQQGERLSDVALKHVQSKLDSVESLQPRVDRRLAEFEGHIRGHAEEIQSIIRQAENFDHKLWDMRAAMQNEVREKVSGLEAAAQSLSSQHRLTRAAHDDELKKCNTRLARLENLLGERTAHFDETSQNVMHLHERLQELEEQSAQSSILARSVAPSDPAARAPDASDAVVLFDALQAQLGGTAQKLEDMRQESQELRLNTAVLEERYNSLRTSVEAKEGYCRKLVDRLEGENWDSRFKDLQSRVNEIDRDRIQHGEKLDIHQRKLQSHEEVHEDLSNQMQRLLGYSDIAFPNGSSEFPADEDQVTGEEMVPMAAVDAVRESINALADEFHTFRTAPGPEKSVARATGEQMVPMAAVDAVRERVSALADELQALRTAGMQRAEPELERSVAVLVEQLKGVVPKVTQQDAGLKDLREQLKGVVPKVNQQGAGLKDLCGELGGHAKLTEQIVRKVDSMDGRVDHVEAQVRLLTAEAEGGSRAPPGALAVPAAAPRSGDFGMNEPMRDEPSKELIFRKHRLYDRSE